jgi:hypothetical protein
MNVFILRKSLILIDIFLQAHITLKNKCFEKMKRYYAIWN